MDNLRYFAIREFDPLVAESAVQAADMPASPDLLHRPAGRYQLNVHGVVRGPVSIEQACCTDRTGVRLPSEDVGYVISFSVRGTILAIYRGREFVLGPGHAIVFQPPAEMLMTIGDDFDVFVVRLMPAVDACG